MDWMERRIWCIPVERRPELGHGHRRLGDRVIRKGEICSWGYPFNRTAATGGSPQDAPSLPDVHVGLEARAALSAGAGWR